MKKELFIADIGKVIVKKNKLAKSIKLRIVPKKGLTVTIPYFCAFEEAYRAIEHRKNWIQKHLNEVKLIEKKEQLSTVDFPFYTFEHKLVILEKEIKNFDIKTNGKEITIFKPIQIPFENSKNQDYLKFLIRETYRFEAKRFIPERVHFFATQFNLVYNRVSIKDQKSRWGSCSSQNNLNFNLNLMKLPEHLRDYVILHELAHIKEKNHRQSFWKLLDTYTNNNAKKWDKELNEYNHFIGQ